MSVEPPQSAQITMADHALVRVLQQAGVSQSDLIHVTGPGSLPALLWLCRRGYERAQHLTTQSPRCATEAADALLIPHLSETCDLTSLLQSARCLREGGVLVIRAGARGAPAFAAANAVLAFGYRLERQVSETGHTILVARREGLAAQRKVA